MVLEYGDGISSWNSKSDQGISQKWPADTNRDLWKRPTDFHRFPSPWYWSMVTAYRREILKTQLATEFTVNHDYWADSWEIYPARGNRIWSQHTATRCNSQQFTTTHCNSLQHIAVHCHTLQQRVLPRYGGYTLQHTATHCNTLQHTVSCCNLLQRTATHCNSEWYRDMEAACRRLRRNLNLIPRYGLSSVAVCVAACVAASVAA